MGWVERWERGQAGASAACSAPPACRALPACRQPPPPASLAPRLPLPRARWERTPGVQRPAHLRVHQEAGQHGGQACERGRDAQTDSSALEVGAGGRAACARPAGRRRGQPGPRGAHPRGTAARARRPSQRRCSCRKEGAGGGSSEEREGEMRSLGSQAAAAAPGCQADVSRQAGRQHREGRQAGGAAAGSQQAVGAGLGARGLRLEAGAEVGQQQLQGSKE